MGTQYNVRVICFEISQSPSQQTDYYHTIKAEAPYRREMESWIYGIHKALAEPLIKSQALIVCAANFSPDNEMLACVCFCKRIEIDGRPILKTQAVITPIQELEQARLQPINLYYSDIWQQIDRWATANLTASCSAPPRYQYADRELVQAVAQALIGNTGRTELLEDLEFEPAMALLRQAMDDLSEAQKMSASFAIGVPLQRHLPTKPTLVISTIQPPAQAVVRHNNDAASTWQEPSYGRSSHDDRRDNSAADAELYNIAEDYKSFLATMAAEVMRKSRLPAHWQSRLWNKCQDLITSLEVLQWKPNSKIYHRRIASASDELVSEVRRIGIDRELKIQTELQHRARYLQQYSPWKRKWKAFKIPLLITGVLIVLILGYVAFVLMTHSKEKGKAPASFPGTKRPLSQPRKSS